MSWEDVAASFDGQRPEDIVIHLDLCRFTELVGRVVSETHRIRGLEMFDPHDPEGRHLVIDAWRYVCHMADRAEFEKSVAADLENLAASSIMHLPEFGGAAPLPGRPRAPESLNRRLDPPV